MTNLEKAFSEIVSGIVENSGGRASLVEQEPGNHFLKVDGKTVGRSVDYYSLMGRLGVSSIINTFRIEIVIELKKLGLENSYQSAGKRIRRLGQEFLPETMQSSWSNLFSDIPEGGS